MFISITMTLITFIISNLMIIISIIISKKKMKNKEKLSPFECGFNPLLTSRIPFSLQFIMISIIFLIFDIEISLILPMIITLNFNLMNTWLMTILFFILILILGIFYEWSQNFLAWKI
uniref:NADH-ubiquinone oxidoreductase chain 3 n=1 Tax=Macrostemum floridum TaxID=486976 RepID=A0A7L8XEK6_9NEOP|nr:NADH dehydrogenase subunit 3 [Macrostemum floridum]QOH91258.1 NADH dehydrogenase subunit 3 [Macrostemum floridum]